MKNRTLFKPYTGNEGYFYASYSRKDARLVYEILSGMHEKGYRIWYGGENLSGADYAERIVERIDACEVFLCFLSSKYLEEQSCMQELQYALHGKKQVITIKLEDVSLPRHSSFGLSLSTAEPVNFSGFGSSKELVEDLCGREEEAFSGCRRDDEERSKSAGPAEPPARRRLSLSGMLSAAGKSIADKVAEKRQNAAKEKAPPSDRVNFSVLSPKAVKPDSYGVIDLHMYTDADREAVDKAIRESSGTVNETVKSGFDVSRNTSVTARLEAENVEIPDNLETQIWNGKSLHFDFRFYVPETYRQSQIAFVCYIECNGIPITRLNFLTAVSRLPDPDALPAKVTKNDYKKAFISYSRRDEQRMLARVVGIQEHAQEMKFWLDKQSLDAGDIWRDEIRKAIMISDVLLLFWSVPASQSKEVENEWRYGLEQRGLAFIAPVPLDPPNQCPPPDALKELNFTVRAFYKNELTEKLSYYNSDNIVLV